MAVRGRIDSGRPADAHLVTLRTLMERSAEWNDDQWVLQVDVGDAIGSIGYEVLWNALRRGSGQVLSTSCAP